MVVHRKQCLANDVLIQMDRNARQDRNERQNRSERQDRNEHQNKKSIRMEMNVQV